MNMDGCDNVLAVSDTRIKRKHKLALQAVGNHYHAYSGLSYFNPSALAKAREGTFKPSTQMGKYLSKQWKHSIPKEECEAQFNDHSRPDLYSCAPPN